MDYKDNNGLSEPGAYQAEADAVADLVGEVDSFDGQQKLKNARLIQDIPMDEGRILVERLYVAQARHKGQTTNMRLLATVLNLAITDRRGTFLMSEGLLDREYLKADKNAFEYKGKKVKARKSISGEEWNNFVGFVLGRGLMELAYEAPEGSGFASAFAIVMPEAVQILERLVGGREALAAQRMRVVEYAEGTGGDDDGGGGGSRPGTPCGKPAGGTSVPSSEASSGGSSGPVSAHASGISLQHPQYLQDHQHQQQAPEPASINNEHHSSSCADRRGSPVSGKEKWRKLLYVELLNTPSTSTTENATGTQMIPLCQPIWDEIYRELSEQLRRTEDRFNLPLIEGAYLDAVGERIKSDVESLDDLLKLATNEYYGLLIAFLKDINGCGPHATVKEKCREAVWMAQYLGLFPVQAFKGVVGAHFAALAGRKIAREGRKDPIKFLGADWDPELIKKVNERGAEFGSAATSFLLHLEFYFDLFAKEFRNYYFEVYSCYLRQRDRARSKS